MFTAYFALYLFSFEILRLATKYHTSSWGSSARMVSVVISVVHLRLTGDPTGQLKTSANLLNPLSCPLLRYWLGEWGSVRIRERAAAGLMSCAQTREDEMKNSCSLTHMLAFACHHRLCTHSVYLIPGSLGFFTSVESFFQAEYANVIPESPKSSPFVNYHRVSLLL